jgi:3-oxoadipate enol-lactonase
VGGGERPLIGELGDPLVGRPAAVRALRLDPDQHRPIAAAIPAARYVEIPEAGHAVPIQCAERINALLVEHFSAVAIA